MPLLDEFRAKYPQYAEVPDGTLAGAIYKKYYADKLPPDEFLNKVFSSPKSQDTPQGSLIGGIAENAAALGTRAALAIPAGLAGIGRSLYGWANGETSDQQNTAGGQMVRDVLSLGYDPKTVQGQAIQAGISAPFEKGGELALKYGGPEGKLAFDVGSQLALAGRLKSAIPEPRLAPRVKPPLPSEAAAALDSQVKNTQLGLIDALKNQAAAHYDTVASKVGLDTRIDLPNAKAYIENRIREVDGNTELLAPAERRLALLVRGEKPEVAPKVTAEPGTPEAIKQRNALTEFNANRKPPPAGDTTYQALDSTRKDVGDMLATAKGEDRLFTKRVYDLLKQDQQVAATQHGAIDSYKAASNLASQYLGLQRGLKKNYGRELDNSILPKIDLAARKLAKGDVSAYQKLIKNIPDNMRGQIDQAVAEGIQQQGTATTTGVLRNLGARHPYLPIVASGLLEHVAASFGVPYGVVTGVGVTSAAMRARKIAKANQKVIANMQNVKK